MKKVSTAARCELGEFPGQRLTIGLDLRDRSSWYCVLDEQGELLVEQLSGATTGAEKLGQSEPQLHISKEDDPYLRTLTVQGAHHILGPFGADSDLRQRIRAVRISPRAVLGDKECGTTRCLSGNVGAVRPPRASCQKGH
jgi:hypothetical protein